jgi:hypothetical protein
MASSGVGSENNNSLQQPLSFDPGRVTHRNESAWTGSAKTITGPFRKLKEADEYLGQQGACEGRSHVHVVEPVRDSRRASRTEGTGGTGIGGPL